MYHFMFGIARRLRQRRRPPSVAGARFRLLGFVFFFVLHRLLYTRLSATSSLR